MPARSRSLLTGAALGVLAAALLLLGLACQPGGPAARGRGELRVLLPGEPRTLDPNTRLEEIPFLLAPSLFDSLVALDADGRLLPDLAERWEVKAGGTVYVFHLREGVRWHDGHPFSPDDVRFTFERLAKYPSFADEAVRRVTRVEAPDERTVEIHLREPWAPFLTTIGWTGAYILPRHRARGLEMPGLEPGKDLAPVGTGPFRFAGWTPGQAIALTRNPDRPVERAVERLVFRFEPDPVRATEKMTAGEADYAITRQELDRIPRLQRTPGLKVLTSPSASRFLCSFNLRREPLQDRRVREAINRAIDRHELVEKALYGYGAPAFGFYTPAVSWAYNAAARVPDLDLKRARALLDEAGLRPRPDGTRFALDLVATTLPPGPEMTRLIQAQLRQIGIEVRPVLLPIDEWMDRTIGRQDFDLLFQAGGQGPDPENLRFRFGSRGPAQILGYASDAFDAAVAEGAATVDLARRAQAYFRAQEILARDLPFAPLAEAVHIAVYRSEVSGLPQAEARGLVPLYDFSRVRVTPP